jgi:DnaJ-class molecular chaperone
MAEDYYQTLGVSRTAKPEEIQKAYRRLARKYHPDLHEDKKRAKEQFQRVQHAYDILSDPQKREMYDQFGPGFESAGAGHGPFERAQGGGPPFGQIDLEELLRRAQQQHQQRRRGKARGGDGGGMGTLEDFLRQMGGFAGGPEEFSPGGFSPYAEGAAPSLDLEEEITIPFSAAVLGGRHQLMVQRPDGSAETISIKIPVGIESGKKIRLRGQGARSPDGRRAGDLLVKVRVADHPHFQRRGNDLLVKLPVTLKEAALGAKIDLETPHGSVAVTVPRGSSGGRLLRLKGLGIRPNGRPAGDLIAELRIVIPSVIDGNAEQLINSLDDRWGGASPRDQLHW